MEEMYTNSKIKSLGPTTEKIAGLNIENASINFRKGDLVFSDKLAEELSKAVKKLIEPETKNEAEEKALYATVTVPAIGNNYFLKEDEEREVAELILNILARKFTIKTATKVLNSCIDILQHSVVSNYKITKD